MQSRESYILSGGKIFNYIPALNDCDENIESMEKIILNEISGWDNNSINSTDNLKMTKQIYDKHAYNKKT